MGLDRAAVERVGRGVGPTSDADHCIDVRNMALDGPDALVQLFGDLAIGPSRYDRLGGVSCSQRRNPSLSMSMRSPSCQTPSGPRSYLRMIPTLRKPTLS
jgi:hypothetical protein